MVPHTPTLLHPSVHTHTHTHTHSTTSKHTQTLTSHRPYIQYAFLCPSSVAQETQQGSRHVFQVQTHWHLNKETSSFNLSRNRNTYSSSHSYTVKASASDSTDRSWYVLNQGQTCFGGGGGRKQVFFGGYRGLLPPLRDNVHSLVSFSILFH